MQVEKSGPYKVVNIHVPTASIETLLEEWSKSVNQGENGAATRELIERNLDAIANNHHLPRAPSFKQLVEMYDRRRYRDMLRVGEIDKVVSLIDNAKGSRTTNLVAQAAFECEDYLPSIKEGAALIVAIMKKLNLHDQAESAIARYSAFVEGRAVADNSLVVEIGQLLAEENDARLLQSFVTIFKYM